MKVVQISISMFSERGTGNGDVSGALSFPVIPMVGDHVDLFSGLRNMPGQFLSASRLSPLRVQHRCLSSADSIYLDLADIHLESVAQMEIVGQYLRKWFGLHYEIF